MKTNTYMCSVKNPVEHSMQIKLNWKKINKYNFLVSWQDFSLCFQLFGEVQSKVIDYTQDFSHNIILGNSHIHRLCILRCFLLQNLREEQHEIRARICKPFKEPRNFFPARRAVVRQSWAGIFKESMGARNRGGIGLSYRPARLHRLADFIPWNRFLGSINV